MKVVVVGGGASGMIAAITSAKQGNETILVEKTSSLGNKIKITGKGRCNVTFDGDIEDFKENIKHNNKFMYSSYMNFSNKDVVEYFNSQGVETKLERGGRIFPVSDKAQDIVDALVNDMKANNVKVMLNTELKDLIIKDETCVGIKTQKEEIYADKVIIATGGKSYPSTGKNGITITKLLPGLVPLRSEDKICKELQGLTLKNVSLKIIDGGKTIYDSFGEMLFAHFGLTGPIVLSSSSILNRVEDIDNKLKEHKITASIDLKPALDIDTLDKRIQRDFQKYTNKEFKNALDDLLPQKLIPVIISRSGIDESKKVHQITKEERENLVKAIKNLEINITGFLGYDVAIITCGGVDVKQINPKTMETKSIKNLFIVGEALDVDALTGGFNLQIAFSTGVAAGNNY